MLLYYITDRSQFLGSASERQRSLLNKIAEAARCGVDLIQLREKDLSSRELESIARAAVEVFHRDRKPGTGLLINSRSDVALACAADGVHLRSDDISSVEVRNLWQHGEAFAGKNSLPRPMVGVSCHSRPEVARAASDGADFVVFAPVFEKQNETNSRPAGLDALRQACREEIPVLALGGVTLANAQACLQAGAAGVAGIRLFQQNDLPSVVRRLRELSPYPEA